MVVLVPARAIWVVKRILDPEGRNVGGSHIVLLLEPGRKLVERIWDDGAREVQEGGRWVFLGRAGPVVVVVVIHGGQRVRAGQRGEALYLSDSGSGQLSLLLCGPPMP